MNPTIKRYIISSLVTFLTSFFGVLSLQLANGISGDVTGSVIFGIVSVAARAGIKALVENVAIPLAGIK